MTLMHQSIQTRSAHSHHRRRASPDLRYALAKRGTRDADLDRITKELDELRKTSERITQIDADIESGVERLDSVTTSLVEADQQLESVTTSLRELDVHLASLRRTLQKVNRVVPFADIADDAPVGESEDR
jgi:chromosome segregation ATPase